MRVRPTAALGMAALVLTSCVARGEVAEPAPTTTPSATATPTATPTDEPRLGLAASTSDPGALAIATLRARREGLELVAFPGLPLPEHRERLRALDEVEVLATTAADAARLARSVGISTEVARDVAVGSAAAALADLVLSAAHGTDRPDLVTLVDSLAPEAILAATLASGPNELPLAVEGDLRADGPWSEALRATVNAGLKIDLPTARQDDAWQLDVVADGRTVPGGGQLLGGRRFIAAYGTPGTPSLGVLGEQGVAAAHERILQIAEPYDDGTLPIVPTFEIIAAVASASATEDGDYSYGISFDLIREWVDYAADNDILVILDIQPGRTDFLTHAKQYEEFLVQPHVGLALDPEWRLKSNQVHLRQIGTVDAAEVNTVVEWLAGLVREHDLPQKMLILHQFRASMITNKDLVLAPEELFTVLHFDGQGGQPAKDSGYLAYAVGDERFTPGWKNFYDEDRPMAGADKVLSLEPPPIYISFQ